VSVDKAGQQECAVVVDRGRSVRRSIGPVAAPGYAAVIGYEQAPIGVMGKDGDRARRERRPADVEYVPTMQLRHLSTIRRTASRGVSTRPVAGSVDVHASAQCRDRGELQQAGRPDEREDERP
jgi:hypothetical protein